MKTVIECKEVIGSMQVWSGTVTHKSGAWLLIVTLTSFEYGADVRTRVSIRSGVDANTYNRVRLDPVALDGSDVAFTGYVAQVIGRYIERVEDVTEELDTV